MAEMTKEWVGRLPAERAEQALPDAKPIYTDAEALLEAHRCLYCHDAPCITACPTGIDIPHFIKQIAAKNLRGSATTILSANMLGLSCARVCPVEVLCAGACVYNDLNHTPIQIGRLQRYAMQGGLAHEAKTGRRLFSQKPRIGKKVALIGAGPASLACAAHLALEGVQAIVFEKADIPGGLNTTGIAPYKFQADDALAEIQWLLGLGIELRTGITIANTPTADAATSATISFTDLRRDFDAVFVGVGMGEDNFTTIPGSDGPGVWGAVELIAKIKTEANFRVPADVRAVAVIGAGNTAIDIARELAMLGVPDVAMIYRRTKAEMSGYAHELAGARHYGVRLIESSVPIEILRDGDRLTGLKCRRPAAAGGANANADAVEFVHGCEWVVQAIGQAAHASRLGADLALDAKGNVAVDPITRATSVPNVYAGGDCINGGKEVVNAVADGRDAAFAMLRSWGITADLARH